jgi:hypothetical protein
MVEIFFCKREVLKRIYSFILTRTIHPNLATLQQASGYTTGIQQLLRSVTQPEEYSLYFRVSRDACSKEYWRYILFSNFFKLVNSTDSRKSLSRATRRLARFLFALFQSFSFFVFIVKIVNWKRKKTKTKQNKKKKIKSKLQEELVPVLRLKRLMDRFDPGLRPLGAAITGLPSTTWMCWPTNFFSHLVHFILCASWCVRSSFF